MRCNKMFYKTWQLKNLRGDEIHMAVSQENRSTYSVKLSIMGCAPQMLISLSGCRNTEWRRMLIFLGERNLTVLMFVSTFFNPLFVVVVSFKPTQICSICYQDK